jgi:hypothetical protein
MHLATTIATSNCKAIRLLRLHNRCLYRSSPRSTSHEYLLASISKILTFCTTAPELFLLVNSQRTMLCLKCLFNYLVSPAIYLRHHYHRRQVHFFFPCPAQPSACGSILKGSAKGREERTTRSLRFPCRVRDRGAAATAAVVVS